jgi:hypothetical protein
MGATLGSEGGAPVSRSLRRIVEVTKKVPLAKITRGEDRSRLDHALDLARKRLVFPYEEGMMFASDLYRAGGFPLVDGAFAHPPRSTEQILHPERYLAGDQPRPVATPKAPTGYTLVTSDTLGELDTRTLLSRCMDPAVANRAAGAGHRRRRARHGDRARARAKRLRRRRQRSRAAARARRPLLARVALPEPHRGTLNGDVYYNKWLGHMIERPSTFIAGGLAVSTRVANDEQNELTFREVQQALATDFSRKNLRVSIAPVRPAERVHPTFEYRARVWVGVELHDHDRPRAVDRPRALDARTERRVDRVRADHPRRV